VISAVPEHDQPPAPAPATRRKVLAGGAAVLAAAGLPAALDPGRPARAEAARPSGLWGRIANHGRRGDRVLSALFFGGPPNPVTEEHFYARHPLDEDRLDWSDRADIDFAVDQYASAGLNTMKLSYFGHLGETERWAPAFLFSQRRWEGTGTYTEAEQVQRVLELFDSARRHNILIAPMLEVSPDFRFWAEFPTNLDNLVERAVWLLNNFGGQPNYLRLYDAFGREARAIWLIESIHFDPIDPDPIDPVSFAAGFDRAVDLICQRVGYRVGVVVDPSPLPGYGSHDGPEPEVLRDTPSVLAINPYNITSQGLGPRMDQSDVTEPDRLAYARSMMTRWHGSGIPFFAPVIPGYDDRHLPFREDPAFYGFNPQWLESQRALALEFASAGLSVDTWNGYSEAHAIPPTIEDGDTHLRWLRGIVETLRQRWGQ
jgi:hypothetical protein